MKRGVFQLIKIEVDSKKKAIIVTASGMLKAEEVSSYINELQDAVKRIDPSQFALIIDAREQKAVAPDAVPHLEKALKLYVDIPFAKRFSVVLESTVAMQQVKRVGKDEVNQFIMVNSIDEAFKNL